MAVEVKSIVPEDCLVSVVVPVYKAEEFLPCCIGSICNQTYSNLEIILVDDGSPDNSGKLCDKLAIEECRIHVIHKLNQGAGFARNTGIQYATGEWVTFVDADDWLEPTFIEMLVEAAIRNQSDMVTSGKKKIFPGGRTIAIPSCEKEEVYDNKQNILENVFYPFFGNDLITSGKRDRMGVAVWANLYSTDILKNSGLLFRSERDCMSEDLLFNAEYTLLCKRIVRIPVCHYCYRFNPSSFSNSFREERIIMAQRLYYEQKKMLDKEQLTAGAGWRVERAYMMEVRHLLMQAADVLNLEKCLYYYHKILQDDFLQRIARLFPSQGIPARERIMVTLIRSNARLMLFLYLKAQCCLVKIKQRI